MLPSQNPLPDNRPHAGATPLTTMEYIRHGIIWTGVYGVFVILGVCLAYVIAWSAGII